MDFIAKSTAPGMYFINPKMFFNGKTPTISFVNTITPEDDYRVNKESPEDPLKKPNAEFEKKPVENTGPVPDDYIQVGKEEEGEPW